MPTMRAEETSEMQADHLPSNTVRRIYMRTEEMLEMRIALSVKRCCEQCETEADASCQAQPHMV